jgi:hypothetical protein
MLVTTDLVVEADRVHSKMRGVGVQGSLLHVLVAASPYRLTSTAECKAF